MFVDLCMLDELAMRLRVAGTYALEFGNGYSTRTNSKCNL